MLATTTIAIMGLHLRYNSSNIRYIFCNKPFQAFLEHQISKDKPTSLPTIKKLNFYILYYFHATACHFYGTVIILYKGNYKSQFTRKKRHMVSYKTCIYIFSCPSLLSTSSNNISRERKHL